MDVQCERCKTEYEFDDALVSARGTTVKCTNCGFQFKIRPPAAAGEAERWVVDTTGGQRLVFTSLRDLQKAITHRQVGRGDTLTRGNAPPRPLGSIAELEPFFTEASGAGPVGRSGAAAVSRDGTSASSAASAASFPRQPPRLEFEASVAQAAPPQQVSAFAATVGTPHAAPQPAPPPRQRSDTLRPPDDLGGAVPPPPQRQLAPMNNAPVQAAPIVNVDGSYRGGTQLMPQQAQPPAPAYAPPTAASPGLPPPTSPVRRPMYSEDYDASEPLRGSMPSMTESEALYPSVPRSRRVGGWVITFVVLIGAGVIGYYALRPYLAALTKGTAAPVALDARAQQFLADGERALSEGNIEAAKENFDKASALAEKDAHVLLDVARLSTARADIQWLKLRLLPAEAQDDIRATKQTLDDLASAARKAADAALTAAPEDPAAVRTKVDALRIIGERDAARSYVAKIIASAAQPETAYVLAALDLSEIDPLWPTVIDRLRVAAAGEGNAGRARAALVYALSRSGDTAGAKAELDKLGALTRPHPLLGALRAFVSKVPALPDAGVVATAKNPPPATGVDVGSLPRDNGGGGSGLSGDPRALLEQAENAKNRGDHARAKMLYEAALAKSPSDSQALAGLGDCAHSERDIGSAKSFYQRALASNPNYLPALIGLADVEWEEGDHPRAQKAYKDITDRFPDGSYPTRVKQRAEGSSGSSPAPGGDKQLTVPANTPNDLSQ
jgi:predicted Zn finger-like uncharacterized protein